MKTIAKRVNTIMEIEMKLETMLKRRMTTKEIAAELERQILARRLNECRRDFYEMAKFCEDMADRLGRERR